MSSQHRLYLSGLAPTIKANELVSRFSSFGSVIGGEDGIGGLGVDGNGTPRTFAFLTLEATDAQLKRCTSMLSGSMWKGHKLRIAPANPDFTARLEKERQRDESEVVKKRSRKRKRLNTTGSDGTLARDFEVVTPDNIQGHKGWTLDPLPVPTPIFPLITRPTRPLPAQPPKAASTSWTRETARAKASKAARAAQKLGTGPVVEPLSRARIVRIDPRRWARRKVVFPAASEPISKGSELRGKWECVEADDGTAHGRQEVVWVFKANDGSIRRQEVVRLTQRGTPHTDRFASLLDGLVVVPPVEAVAEESAAPTGTPQAAVDRPQPRPRSPSPPPYVSAAPRTLLFNEDDSFALLAATQGESELQEAARRERATQLELIQSLLGDAAPSTADSKSEVVRSLPPVEGFGEDDSGSSEAGAESEVLRLRGGAATGSDSDEADSDSMDTANGNAKDKGLRMGQLKSMFQPQESAQESFSLLSGFDLELEPEPVARSPSPPPPAQAAPARAFVPPPALGRQTRAWVGTGPVTPFFPFPSGSFENSDGAVNGAEADKLGISSEQASRLAAESHKRLHDEAKSFWRTDTTDEIETKHQALREVLRGHARKRHREASKRGRKLGRGNKRED